MNTKKKAALAVTVMILAISVLAGFGLAQRQPRHQVVTFEAFFDTEQPPAGEPGPKAEDDPNWYGQVTLTIDGQTYEGTAAWQSVKGHMLEHGYSGIDMVADGTGAFEKAIGMFYLLGHTEWWIDANGSQRGEAVYAGSGPIEGIMLPQE